MTPRKILLIALTAVMLAGVGAFGPAKTSAQEVQVTGPLAGQPAVRRLRIYRKGRFEITPSAAFTLQDEFSRTIGFGASATYHLTDWFGIGAFGFFAPIHIDTALTDQVAELGQTTSRNALSLPSRQGFPEQIATIDWMATLQAVFIPLRGKLSLFQKLFVDTDFYLAGGLAFVGVSERADVAEGVCPGREPVTGFNASQECLDTQQARAARVAITGTFAAGLRLYINQFMALNLEWRALPFEWNTGGFDVDGATNRSGDGGFADGRIDATDRLFHFNHMFVLGYSFYLPTRVQISD
jgi:outer membrane beta-barrel protein